MRTNPGEEFKAIDDSQAWDRLVRSLPAHSIYQAWSWGEIRRGEGRTVRRYCLFVNGEPQAAASVELRPIRRLGRPTGYAPRGPLWRSEEGLSRFLVHLAGALRREGALSLKINPQRSEACAPLLRRTGFFRVNRDRLTFGGVLPVLTARIVLRPTLGLQLQAVEPNARRRIRQARRRGVAVWPSTGEEALAAFHPLLRRLAEERGFPCPDRAAFGAMVGTWASRGEGSVFLAEKGGEVAGGAVLSFFGEEAYGHFIADDPRFRPLSVTYALYWAGIEEAHRRGCRVVDLGGIRAPDGTDNLFEFKRQFGARPFRLVGEWNRPLDRLAYGALALLSGGGVHRRV